MLFQTKPALPSHQLSLEFGRLGALVNHHHASNANNRDGPRELTATSAAPNNPSSSTRSALSPFSSSLSELNNNSASPSSGPSSNQAQSQLSPWGYPRRSCLASKPEYVSDETSSNSDRSSSSSGGSRQSTGDFGDNATSPSSSSSSSTPTRTLGFVVVSSPELDSSRTDDVIIMPKVEEIDDITPMSEVSEEPNLELVVPSPGGGDMPNGGNHNNGTALPKRRRGRPRKHPPPVPGQAKVAKGRSKTGCITCRRRKKKCDETKPACQNCQKNAVVCEGYPLKEIWKSGKQRAEEARRNSLAPLPRGLPVLIDGIETEIDHRFLDHFVYNFSRVLTLINDDSNPFKEIILPMATQHQGLMHSLMCLSGSHLSARDPEPSLKERQHYHFSRAIADLRSTIAVRTAAEQTDSPVDDPTIASTIALCLNTICEGETRGEYRSHMDAARYLLATQRPRNEKFRQFIVEFFQYHDVSNSLTTLDRRPVCLTGELRLPDFVPHAQAGALLGIFDGLFHYISEITIIRDKIRQRFNQGLEPAVDYETLSEAVKIDSAIRAWQPIYPNDHPNWFAAQLYRQSTWVYLYRTIRPSHPSEKISQVVDDGFRYLDQLPVTHGAYSILLMPLFLLGCSAFEPRQRDRIRSAFDNLKAYSNLRNIEPALTIVEKVWEVMDTNATLSWDWEKIIDEMGMDFLIT